MNWITRMWYQGAWYQWLFLPLSVVFAVISGLRRWFFQRGWFKQTRVGVPVIVVGNISVGGNGKTPVVVALCDALKKSGFRVGVVSRGYGAKATHFPFDVNPDLSSDMTGDEPLLIARRCGVPVVIDPVRPRGANHLISQHQCDVIISDDGLQHYALARDIELVVVDGRLFGNGKLMPMGPLREGMWRLSAVDAIIFNQGSAEVNIPAELSRFNPIPMRFTPGDLINVKHSEMQIQVSELALRNQHISAMAGIGDPQRFFTQLAQMGLTVSNTIALPDHHAITIADIPAGTVIMTEKDAVKVSNIAHDDCWYQPVSASMPDDFYTNIIEQLRRLMQRH
ncbi:tetraacyldisaccharide 4'-kinase [Alteromonas sp. AMM-1]|uniref:tetraacyldisaccharide 4'-kinase n=1 Tax=Alteromonas sp. AMM-1 TaxID=3394233 RepID=UPI0039A7710B